MSVEKVDRYKAQKKNRKEFEKKKRRNELWTRIIAGGIIAVMILSPVAIYLAEFSNNISSTNNSTATPSNVIYDANGEDTGGIDVTDENGNVIGHMHDDGTVHMDDGTTTSLNEELSESVPESGENAEIFLPNGLTDPDASQIIDKNGNLTGYMYSDGTLHMLDESGNVNDNLTESVPLLEETNSDTESILNGDVTTVNESSIEPMVNE